MEPVGGGPGLETEGPPLGEVPFLGRRVGRSRSRAWPGHFITRAGSAGRWASPVLSAAEQLILSVVNRPDHQPPAAIKPINT